MLETGILRIKIPGKPIIEHPLVEGTITIGRAPGNDLIIDHASISRRHARLSIEEGQLYIEDLGSSNGTYFGQTQLSPEQKTPVPVGQKIRLGDVSLRIPSDGKWSARPRLYLTAGILGGILILALLLTGTVIAARSLLSRIQKDPALTTCDAPAMTVIQLGGETVLTGAGVPPSTLVIPTQPTVGPGTPTLTPLPLPTATPVIIQPITSLAFLEMPFPYDGGNENYGGTLAQFRQASQMRYFGGRINSFFDHALPLYASTDGGREPSEPPFGGNILIFDGSIHPNASLNYSGHPGYDYSTFVRNTPTTPLFAAADGVIEFVGEGYAGALVVKIRHRVEGVGEFQTIYMHLHPDQYYQAMRGREGQTISAGTRIGTMGNTGWSTGHHLHFEVRFDKNQDNRFNLSEAVDPYSFIPNASFSTDPWAQRGGPISNYLWIHPLGVIAEILEDGSGQVNQAGDTSGTGGAIEDSTLCAPPGSMPPGGNVYWSWTPDIIFSPDLIGTGHGCAIAVFDPTGNPVTEFDEPVIIQLKFEPSDIADVDPDTLAIHLLDAETGEWEPLETTIDWDNYIAAASAQRPGKCGLLGEPTADFTPPQTNILFSGENTTEGEWFDEVTVTLESSDPSGIEEIEYSIDGGDTWNPYEGPFTMQPSGIPQPIEEIEGESFGFGPGRFVVLASAIDGAGNVEEPPAFRVLMIDPSLNPEQPAEAVVPITDTPSPSPTSTETGTPTPTPTVTDTPTPTPTSTTACATTLTVLQNTFCRTGPGTIYDVVTGYTPGTELELAYQNSSEQFKWWRIKIPDSVSYCYVSDVSVEILGDTSAACVPETPDPPTPTPTPDATNTPTPTPTPDRIPPPAPQLVSPVDFAQTTCSGTINFQWNAVSDPSGIATYNWVLEVEDYPGYGNYQVWQSVSTSSTTFTFNFATDQYCGYNFRWRVQAVDGAGNVGPYSPYFNFYAS
jgi:murein DD-endopeptidase MepM/ murein hydrolase activator NlpD